MAQLLEEQCDIEEDEQKDKFLTFQIAKEEYGIEIKNVTEIMGMQSITGIPELPEFVRGIINLRGKIIPVIDVRLRFKKEPLDYNDRTCTIVIEVDDIVVGLIVDAVSEVISIPKENIELTPKLNQNADNRYIKGIAKVDSSVKLILDCFRLFNDDDIELLGQIAS